MYRSSPLREIALRMLADLRHDTADPETDLPTHLDYGMDIDPKTRRILINVFGCADAEIYTGPDHIHSIVPDLPEILAAFASDYGGEEDPRDSFATFHVLVHVYDEAEQRTHASTRNTVITYAYIGYDPRIH